ncbi:MAG: DUF4242 domain-containing protein [Chloroflexales bacterium]|jgi:Protein of unknown function (DUF4242)
MPKFIIERNIPAVGTWSAETLHDVAQKSNGVICGMQAAGGTIQWVQSYVVTDKIFCVYIAPDEAALREHAERGGFPANNIFEVKTVIDPTTGE